MNGSRYYPRRRGQVRSGLRLSASHHDFIFREPLDPVGDHPWNSELALCGLFRTFPWMIDERAHPALRCRRERARQNGSEA